MERQQRFGAGTDARPNATANLDADPNANRSTDPNVDLDTAALDTTDLDTTDLDTADLDTTDLDTTDLDAEDAGRAAAEQHGPDRRLHAAFAPADLAAIAPLRAALRGALADWDVPALADTAELLATELVANALQHTSAGAVLDAVLGADLRLRVEVRDGDGRLPRPRRATETETDGRGLVLVEALADAWGVRLRAEGKTTWFELAALRS
jgi:anti-sigma regulatory factor (Ser/Thr protein kinase)